MKASIQYLDCKITLDFSCNSKNGMMFDNLKTSWEFYFFYQYSRQINLRNINKIHLSW